MRKNKEDQRRCMFYASITVCVQWRTKNKYIHTRWELCTLKNVYTCTVNARSINSWVAEGEELNETIVYLMRAAIAVYNMIVQQTFTNMYLRQAWLQYHLIKKCWILFLWFSMGKYPSFIARHQDENDYFNVSWKMCSHNLVGFHLNYFFIMVYNSKNSLIYSKVMRNPVSFVSINI